MNNKRKLELINEPINESIGSKQSAEIKVNEQEVVDEEIKSPPKLRRCSANMFILYGKNDSAHAHRMMQNLAEHNRRLRESKNSTIKTKTKTKTKTKIKPSSAFPNLNNSFTLTKAAKKARKEVPQVPTFNQTSIPTPTLK